MLIHKIPSNVTNANKIIISFSQINLVETIPIAFNKIIIWVVSGVSLAIRLKIIQDNAKELFLIV